ncbi:MAG TPA: hypothetical protein VEC58_04185 [Roseiarcus sp.]|nr:hypothetical protein [Roseiarcus sp.]
MSARMIVIAILAVGLATSASAAVTVAPVASGVVVEPVAEGCGPGFWRGPNGVCHHTGAYGAGVVRPCPPGMHLGAEGHRCWPN